MKQRILNYFKEIQVLNKKILPNITENNINSLEERYFNNFSSHEKQELKDIHQKILKRVDTLLPTSELPSYLDSLGFTKPKEDDKEAIKVWHHRIKQALKKGWIYSLSTKDTVAIKSELKKHLGILKKHSDARSLSTDASYEILDANQQITNDIISSLPVVDDITDIMGLIRGEDLAGNKLTWLDYAMQFGPAAMMKLASNKSVKKALKKTADKISALKTGAKNKLAQKLNVVVEKLDLNPKYFTDDYLINGKIKRAKMEFKNAKKLAQSEEVAKYARKEGAKNLNDIHKTLKNGTDQEIKDAMAKFYKDKSAKTMLIENIDNNSAYKDLQNDIIKKMEDIYDDVNTKVGISLKNDPHLQKHMKRYADKGKMVKVEKKFITNASTTKKLGRDNDVTFYAVFENGDKIEVPHNLAKDTYNHEFYASYKGHYNTDFKVVDEFCEEMEQVVTSSKHIEAYSIPDGVDIDDYFKDISKYGFKNNEDQMRTVVIKSKEFFNKADDYAKKIAGMSDANSIKMTLKIKQAQEMTEGMRQSSKQYNNIIKKKAKKYLGSSSKIPYEIRTTMELYEKAGRGLMTPDEVNNIIKKVFKKSPDQVISSTANYLHKLEVVSKVAYQKGQKSLLTKLLKGIKKVPSSRGFTQAIRVSNLALRKREVTDEDFTQARKEYFKSYAHDIPQKDKVSLLIWLENAYPKDITKQEYQEWKKELR